MADPTLDLLVRDPTHNRYMTVPTFADLAAAEELLVKGDFVKVLDSGDRYLVRGINQFEFLGNANSPVEGSGAGAAAAFDGWTPVIGQLEDKAVTDTATSKQLGQGVRVQGEGIDEAADSGAIVSLVSGVPTLTLSTTDETAHSAVLTVGNVVDAEPFTAADNGTLELEVKLAIPSDLTEKRVYIGWLDTMALGSLTPATGSTTTITLTLDDQAGFLLDTGLTAATEWFLATNNANADATQTAASASTGIVATADTYQTFKVVIDTDGNVEGFIDGTSVLEVPLGIDPAAPIAPAVIIVSLDADGIESVDVQYFSVRLNQN